MSATTALSSPPAEPLEENVRLRRWTRKEYHRAAELGLFRPEERLELLDGEILEKMSPQNPPHSNGILRSVRILNRAFGSNHHPRPQLPLALNGRSEPEPDVVVVVGTEDDYATKTPAAADARLVVEVSDSTLRLDRGRKRKAYARAGIMEYWIVNLPQRQLEVHRDPVGTEYRSITVYGEQETVTPLAAPQAAIPVTDLLPPVP
jgi:Uma2 family endonuclease